MWTIIFCNATSPKGVNRTSFIFDAKNPNQISDSRRYWAKTNSIVYFTRKYLLGQDVGFFPETVDINNDPVHIPGG